MEENLSKEESRLFDLIEKFDFEELSEQDRKFVLEISSLEEYSLQRKILYESEAVFSSNTLEPRSLIITSSKNVKNVRVIPLYQALLAVAAVILVFVLSWPKEQKTTNNEVQVSITDTVYKTQFIRDTILKIIPQVKYVIQKEVEFQTVYASSLEEPELLEVAQQFTLPSISKESIQSRGISLKEDQSSKFVSSIPAFQ